MKQKFLLVALVLFAYIYAGNAQTYSVTLKVVDETLGDRTNNVYDQNEVNVFAWLSENFNKGSWTNWWYPFYGTETGEGESAATGQLSKDADAWTWQASFDLPEGDYQWNPYMKTLGWSSMNKAVLYYGENDNLSFSVSGTGEISGITEIVVKNTAFPVTLKVIDESAGFLTNDPAQNETNIFFDGGQPVSPSWVKTNLYWEFISPATGGDWTYRMFSPQGNELEKNGNEWIWSATITVRTGCYTWRPQAISTQGTVNNTIYKYDESSETDGFLQFNVALDGTVSGITELNIPDPNPTSVENNIKNDIQIVTDNGALRVIGAFQSVKIYNLSGVLIAGSNKLGNDFQVMLEKGLYIITIDGLSSKIFIN